MPHHRWFRSTEQNPAITGPFEKEEDFGRAMALRSKEYAASCGEQWWHPDFSPRHLPSSLSGHQLSFSHGTLTPGRILARKVHNPLSGTEEYKVVAIVDWEAAGWYPTYWEYAYGYYNFQ